MRLAATVSVMVLVLSSALSAADKDDFVDFSVDELPGQLYVPPEAADSARPVILFLHGAGETGTNNLLQINGNIDNLLSAAKERGAFLYAPQAISRAGSIFNWNDVERTDRVVQQIEQILGTQNADPDRVYITGLSMGGGGTWNMSSRYPDRFAAAVPIAGVRAAEDFSAEIQLKTPTWAFHARNDSIVSRNFSRNIVNEMLVVSNEEALEFPESRDRETLVEYVNDELNLRYTEYPLGDHFIWSRVYDTPAVYDWMFAQSVPEPTSCTLGLSASLAILCGRRRRRNAH